MGQKIARGSMNCPRPPLKAFVWVFKVQDLGPRPPFEMGSVRIGDGHALLIRWPHSSVSCRPSRA